MFLSVFSTDLIPKSPSVLEYTAIFWEIGLFDGPVPWKPHLSEVETFCWSLEPHRFCGWDCDIFQYKADCEQNDSLSYDHSPFKRATNV